MFFYQEIFREFQKNKVKYVLVGGIAINLHGATRNTEDMDILVEMTSSNLRKIVTILKSHGFKVKQPVDPMGIADKKTRNDWIHSKHMKTFNFYKDNSFEQVDIIIDSPVSFVQAQKDAIIIRIDGLRLPILSIKKLIKMKTVAGRSIDQADIEQLTKIQKMRSHEV